MKKATILTSLFAFMLCFVINSCTNEDELTALTPKVSAVSHRLSAEQAQQNALKFVNNVLTTRGGANNITVSEVKAISAKKTLTHSSADSINLDTLYYVVNFDNNNGFVIASSDDREPPVFAFIEEGTYEESEDSVSGDVMFKKEVTYNAGYEGFICALQEIETKKRTEYHKNPDEDDHLFDGGITGPTFDDTPGDRYNTFKVMSPLLKTKWGQTTYLTYCPENYTGCVITAVSQICSYLKHHMTFIG